MRVPIRVVQALLSAFFFVPLALVALISRFSRVGWQSSPTLSFRLAFGGAPIINFAHWARIMQDAGWEARSYATGFFSIHSRNDWDFVASPAPESPLSAARWLISCVYLMAQALWRADVFFFSGEGFLLSPLQQIKLELALFKIGGKKVVVLPYGRDAYVYRRIRNPSNVHCLQTHYAASSRNQRAISSRIDYYVQHADCFIPGSMGPDGFGRWDALLASHLCINLDLWQRLKPWTFDGPFKIVHSPNHRGVKGTEFLIDAVKQLESEGYNIELLMLEGLKNEEVRRVLTSEASILVELLIGPGHGLSAIEGMASGIPVISNLEDDDHFLPFRRWSFFSECPIVSASPENIYATLKKLIENPQLCATLGAQGREYVIKYHSPEACKYLFESVLEFLTGRKASLLDLYHPLTSDYVKRSPRIVPPLEKNRLKLN